MCMRILAACMSGTAVVPDAAEGRGGHWNWRNRWLRAADTGNQIQSSVATADARIV